MAPFDDQEPSSGYIGVVLKDGKLSIVSVSGMFTLQELGSIELLIQSYPEQFRYGEGMYLFSCRAKELHDEHFWVLSEAGFSVLKKSDNIEDVFLSASGSVQ